MATLYKQIGVYQTTIHPFPFKQDVGVYPAPYLFHVSVFVNVLILSFLLWKDETIYRFELSVFFLLAVGNLIDFLLRNGLPFTHVWGISVTYTLLSAIAFLLVILWQILK